MNDDHAARHRDTSDAARLRCLMRDDRLTKWGVVNIPRHAKPVA